MDIAEIVDGAIGPFPRHCGGYLEPGTSGMSYVSTLLLATAAIDIGELDTGLAGIVAFDRAERNGSYIGQINMVTASSFCGPSGVVWGYDLAKADDLYESTNQIANVRRHDGKDIPVWTVEPLLDATKRLFGSALTRRFPPNPGSAILCANKSVICRGFTDVWCAIGLGIAEDRSSVANIFVEDASDTEHGQETPVNPVALADTILRCGHNQGVLYREIFVGTKILRAVPKGYMACALTCAPYVSLAREAIPSGCKARDLVDMTIGEWEESLSLEPLRDDVWDA